MLVQIESSVGKCVTIKAAKSLKDCINVADITYMNVLPQQSDSFVVFLHTSSDNFSDNAAIHNIDIIQLNIES